MCGIVGYISNESEATPFLLQGLSSLEYRGYDSAGIAVIGAEGNIGVHKAVGRLETLRQKIGTSDLRGTVGIGHTRWATHGRPTVDNAHPHFDCREEIAVVHNGIVENFPVLRQRLEENGHHFSSQTDTEIISHMVEDELKQGLTLEAATRVTLARLEGAMSVLIGSTHDPGNLVAFRKGNAGGLVVGYGDGEMFITSDMPALPASTSQVVHLRNGEGVTLSSEEARFWDIDGQAIFQEPRRISQDPVAVAKNGYKHFMLKEMFEQSNVVADVMSGRVDLDVADLKLEELAPLNNKLSDIERVVLTACGSSLHAAMVGQRYIESISGIHAEVELASELRYRDIQLGPKTLVVSVTQSGETVDTLAAMDLAQQKKALQITLTNAMESQSARIADGIIDLRAGLEIGVASTKTFVSSLVSLYLLAIHLGRLKGTLTKNQVNSLTQDLAHLPHLVSSIQDKAREYEEIARYFARSNAFTFIGRGYSYPIALEGALKLKELAYIQAEGYAGGEMKHGPIALVDENMPTFAIALRGKLFSKMLSNIEEILARDGKVIALVCEGDERLVNKVDHVVSIPDLSTHLSPILAAIPLQLFAYHIGVLRGSDVDQPRNLAKSVTVE
ncbi:glutamine--fructose-6-phosphate transaminase (isomerizing) [Dehalococcoidia bacterium]|nr:glutamine--fructose-6-phosphate transaminase (isomerizing) [Dehalococcoidia bacterium]